MAGAAEQPGGRVDRPSPLPPERFGAALPRTDAESGAAPYSASSAAFAASCFFSTRRTENTESS